MRDNRAVRGDGVIHRSSDDKNIKLKIEIEGNPQGIKETFGTLGVGNKENIAHSESNCPFCSNDLSQVDHAEACELSVRHNEFVVDYDLVEADDSVLGRWGDLDAELIEPTPERINVALKKQDGTLIAKLQAWAEEDDNGESIIRVSMTGDGLSQDEFIQKYAPIMREYYEHEMSEYNKNPDVRSVQPKALTEAEVVVAKKGIFSNDKKDEKKEKKSIFSGFGKKDDTKK